MYPFNNIETANNAALLAKYGKGSLCYLQLTGTALEKSVIDATKNVREHFLKFGLHDYSQQAQGAEHKVIVETVIVADDGLHSVKTSLYRPNTKTGDPRMWIGRLGRHMEANQTLALWFADNTLYVYNLSTGCIAITNAAA